MYYILNLYGRLRWRVFRGKFYIVFFIVGGRKVEKIKKRGEVEISEMEERSIIG